MSVMAFEEMLCGIQLLSKKGGNVNCQLTEAKKKIPQILRQLGKYRVINK